MAVPKKKTSVSRKGMRRGGQTHKLYRKFPMKCPNCGENEIVRCKHCRDLGSKYTCESCKFSGPN